MSAFRNPASQRGFSLLETAVVVVIIGALVTGGFLLIQARKPMRQVQAQEDALQWADQALTAYAAQNAHLPCAVKTPNGSLGDCVAPGQKGWLPTRALQSVHPGGGGAIPPVRYMVYRGDGSSTDLASAINRFEPHKWDLTTHDFKSINGLDMCVALQNAAKETASGVRNDRARTSDIDGHAINVAYGLSIAGATPGASGLFDGDNQQSSASMESPSRGNNDSYDDRVRVRDFNSLAQTLGCEYIDSANPDGLMPASLDGLALAVDVSDEVDQQKATLVTQTQGAVDMAIVSEVFATVNVALAAAGIANSASTLVTGSTQLSTAISTCPIPPFASCALIPPYTAGVISAGIAVGLGAGATVAAAVALGLATASLTKTTEARDMAKAASAPQPADVSGLAKNACIAAHGGWLTEKYNTTSGKLETVPPYWKDGLEQEVASLQQKLNQTIADRDAAENRLRWLGEIPSHLIDYPPKPTRRSWQHCIKDKDGKTTCHTDYESDASLNQRIAEWLQTRADMEAELQPKLAAIRAAEQAYYDWKALQVKLEQATKQRNDMRDAIDNLTKEVAGCGALTEPENGPIDSDNDEISDHDEWFLQVERCKNNTRALKGMTTCDPDILTEDQIHDRMCLAWKEDDLVTAQKNERAAWLDYIGKQSHAVSMSQPPITNYMGDGTIPGNIWNCIIAGECKQLIIPWQHFDEDDKRETYAMTYYKLLGLRDAVVIQTDELEKKEAAYDQAKQQCDTLSNLANSVIHGSAEILMLQGADEILRGMDCKGATGEVLPLSCAAPAGGTP